MDAARCRQQKTGTPDDRRAESPLFDERRKKEEKRKKRLACNSCFCVAQRSLFLVFAEKLAATTKPFTTVAHPTLLPLASCLFVLYTWAAPSLCRCARLAALTKYCKYNQQRSPTTATSIYTLCHTVPSFLCPKLFKLPKLLKLLVYRCFHRCSFQFNLIASESVVLLDRGPSFCSFWCFTHRHHQICSILFPTLPRHRHALPR